MTIKVTPLSKAKFVKVELSYYTELSNLEENVMYSDIGLFDKKQAGELAIELEDALKQLTKFING